jgi:hypothetical protein
MLKDWTALLTELANTPQAEPDILRLHEKYPDLSEVELPSGILRDLGVDKLAKTFPQGFPKRHPTNGWVAKALAEPLAWPTGEDGLAGKLAFAGKRRRSDGC